MRYELKLMDTISGVGCFGAIPGPNLSLSEKLDHLRDNPFDDYMHQFMLNGMKDIRTKKVEKMVLQATQGDLRHDKVLAALLYESCLVHDRFLHLRPLLEGLDPAELAGHTPAVHLRSHLLADQKEHNKWMSIFAANITAHAQLPAPGQTGLEPLFSNEDLKALPAPVHVGDVFSSLRHQGLPPARERKPSGETALAALKKLDALDVMIGQEMAHRACLSPVSRLRHWVASTKVSGGRHSNSLSGFQTVYGRGFSEGDARASYSMEMVERVSAYANFGKSGITGYARSYPLTVGKHSQLKDKALDPETVRLEVPYTDQPLHWMEGQTIDRSGDPVSILIPAQMVFLFCNLDEQNLFSALGSTGLAAGNTMAEAKVSGLCEVIERDADGVMPFSPDRCFRLEADDPEISARLREYEEGGIQVWFMDMTPEFGVPCYKSVVLGKRGDVNKGSGAGLDGKRAIVSAMTETPYPFPGPESGPAPDGLPVRRLEDLPDYSTGSAEGDLMVLEKTLQANGYNPIYADLTRKDLGLPVVRAIVPGLEIVSDFDRFSRVSPRLYANYLGMFRG